MEIWFITNPSATFFTFDAYKLLVSEESSGDTILKINGVRSFIVQKPEK